MSDQISGVVLSVESARQGVVAVSWVGDQLTVWNAADVDRDGCDVTPDGGVTLFHATGDVVEGGSEDGPDIVAMAQQVPSVWPPAGADDGTGSGEVRLDLWPEVLDVTAEVETADGTTIPVVVPHALRPLLSEGLRDPDSGEQVVCSPRGTGWVIVDVIGRRGEIGMDGLAPAVVQSIEAAAASGVRRWDSINEPDSDGHAAGDLWFQHDTALTGKTIGQWHWDGTAWVKDQYADAVLANIDAGKIVGGTLSGLAGIFSPAPSSLPRTQIVGSTISVIRAGAEGEEVTTVQLGGADDDQLMISDTDGSPLGGIDSDGNVLAQDANVNGNLTVGGVALPDMLAPFTSSLTARQKLGTTADANSLKFNSNELGTTEIIFDTYPGRIYRVTFAGMLNMASAGTGFARFRATSVSSHGSAPVAPSLSSPQCAQSNVTAAVAGVYPVHLEAFVGPFDGTFRVGLSGQTSGGSVIGNFLSNDLWPSQFYVEDMGVYLGYGDGGINTMGGTPYSGSSNSGGSSTKTYTRSWNVAATRTWRNGSVVSGKLMQGYYSPGQRYGLWLWDGSIAATVGSGANIQSCILTVKNVDFPSTLGGSGILRIGHYDSTSLPGSPQTSGGGAVSVSMKAGQTMKIGLPGGWWGGIATGAIRGITLGEVGSGPANNPTYGHFENSATITMTYSK